MHKLQKKEVLRRLSIISGHLKRVTKMVEDDQYCIDTLNQSLAVQRALQKVDSLILDNHLHSCVSDALKGQGKKSDQAISELLSLYERSAR
ncbi:metal-sensitive transcriptional regulator [Patescibacteria group bacterium]|nr:metal-sensitive transcriptional regulator [Patescibacteria group bacterium]MBU1075369.1 metal-sensitive transcriptional regulator [Patescibacteria group bacterium]MBU1951887.1 metal-sensitive transcriptional regulator [Patescibacteria group bacterium]